MSTMELKDKKESSPNNARVSDSQQERLVKNWPSKNIFPRNESTTFYKSLEPEDLWTYLVLLCLGIVATFISA